MIERTSRTRRQGGFTLIELLVVIAIIGVLVSLVAAAVFGFLGAQNKKNTELALQKTHNALEQQWREVILKARAETPPPNVMAMAGNDSERARVIWVKLRLKQEFPMNYTEALMPWKSYAGVPSKFIGPADLPPIREYVTRLQNVKPVDPNTQAAACLLMALQRPRKGNKFNAEETLGASAIRDTDGDGVPEIIDGWGKPVLFFRWGTGNTDLDNSNLSAKDVKRLDRDTEDPTHKLMDSNWNFAQPGAADFQNLCHWITTNGQGKPLESYFTMPVVMSMGPDGLSGLDPSVPTAMRPLTADAVDNIYSFLVKH